MSSSAKVRDALGPSAYYDNASNTGETIPGCHRSKAAEIHIGGGVASANLACSGARTYSQPYSSDSDFKPGLDFYDDGAGHIGQALALQRYAATHNVKMVVALIGANNYHFADIVQTCVEDWYTSPSWWPNYCQDDDNIAPLFTSSNIAAETTNVAGGHTSSRRICTRATGGRRRCAAACARPGTAGHRAGGPASRRARDSTRSASRTCP